MFTKAGIITFTICLCLSVFVGLEGCYGGSRSTPVLPKISQYPGAENIQVDYSKVAGSKPIEYTSFRTSDAPGTVLTFYQNALQQEGWQPVTEEISEKHARFRLIQGCQLSTLNVSVAKSESGHTDVQLDLDSMYCD